MTIPQPMLRRPLGNRVGRRRGAITGLCCSTGEVELPMLHHATARAELVEQRDACGRRVAWTEKPSDAWLRRHPSFICGCPVRSGSSRHHFVSLACAGRSPGCVCHQVDLVVKILCSEDPATGLPVLRARDLGALGVAAAQLWRPHPAMRGGRSIVDEAACVLVQTCCATVLDPTGDDRSELRAPDLVANTPTPFPVTLADGDCLSVLRRWESRFTEAHPDMKIVDGGTRVTLQSGEQQQWRTAMLGMHVMHRGRHYAEFTLIRSTRQGSMSVGVVDSTFRPDAAETDWSATKTRLGWGYWAHSVSHATQPSTCPLPLHASPCLTRAAGPTPTPTTSAARRER